MNDHQCRQEFRIQTLEKKADKSEDRQDEFEKTLAVISERLDNTNGHLSDIKELFRQFPEAEKNTWESHWEKVFKQQSAQNSKMIMALIGAVVGLAGAVVLAMKFIIK